MSSRTTSAAAEPAGEGGSRRDTGRRRTSATAARTLDARLWLAAIVVVSMAVRIALGRRVTAPWIMVDELVYSELAKSISTHGELLVRGVPSTGYGVVYPALVAPAWRLFGPMPAVYAEAKAINAMLMSLAAVPAYFMARRFLEAKLSLIAAALTVLVPSMLYTGMLMTENAFYPIFLTVALLLVATLERPTPLRQLGLLALCLLAFETRAQAAALIPAIATAPVLLALVERRGVRGLRPFLTLYAGLAGSAIVVVAATVASHRSPLSVLGAYEAATSRSYTVSGVAHFFVYHVAELDLSVGIVPFAAVVAIWLAPRAATPAVRAFAVATLALSFWLVLEVAAFASQSFVDRIEERNSFYVAPFALVALVGLAADGVVPVRRRPVAIAAAIAGLLPGLIPFGRFITTSAVSDTFALLPWWWVQDHWIAAAQVRWAVVVVALVGATVFVVLPRRYALGLAVAVAASFVVTTLLVTGARHGIEEASAGSFRGGAQLVQPDWIDKAAGRDASVAVYRTEAIGPFLLWELEFFNRSVGTVYDAAGAGRGDPLPSTPVTRAPSGRLVDAGGSTIEAEYVVVPATVEVAGRLTASDPIGIDLYRVGGPVVVRARPDARPRPGRP